MPGNACAVLRPCSMCRENPWINVNGAPAATIIEQVKRCPSGALSYELRKDAP